MTFSEAQALIRRMYDQWVALSQFHAILEKLTSAESQLADLAAAAVARQTELDTLVGQLDTARASHDQAVGEMADERETLRQELVALQEANTQLSQDRDAALAQQTLMRAQLAQDHQDYQDSLAAIAADRAKELADGIRDLQDHYDALVKQIRDISKTLPETP